MSDSEQELGQQPSLTAEAKKRVKERGRQQIGAAATLAGQKVGSVAQAVRTSGEQLREQGQEDQAKLLDQVARRTQLAGGYLSQADADSLLTDAKQSREKVRERTQQLRQEAGSRLRQQVDTRRTQAGERASSLAQALHTMGEQLRGQGEEMQAMVVDRLAERAERVGSYLSASDADRLLGDLRGYGQRLRGSFSERKQAVSQRTQAVAEKQRSLASKGAGAVKQRAMGVAGAAREKPVRFVLGALVGASLAGRGLRKRGGQQQPEEQLPEPQEAQELSRSELERLTKRELMDRALAAGVPVLDTMTKSQIIDALTASRRPAPEVAVVEPTPIPER